MNDQRIKDIFLANGFTVKDGETDLKPYVYQAARALLNAAQEPVTHTANSRSPTDYAIEHAEYMAKAAEQLARALNEFDQLAMSHEEDGGADESDFQCAQEYVSEASRGLRSAIYEFRKRRDRSAASPQPDAQAIRDAALEEAVDACRVFAKSLESAGCEHEARFVGGFVFAIRERMAAAQAKRERTA